MLAEGSSVGKWVDEPCKKNNLIVCQKMQIWSLSQMQKSFLEFRKNPVPIGFIYVQLPSQPEPKTLWPTIEWENVSPDYAGHFFRAEGGDASTFGAIQKDNSPRLIRVTQHCCDNYTSIVDVHADGSESRTIPNGPNINNGNGFLLFSVTVSGGEVRPINQAVRIWKRTK
jgi:hypothetical protein